MEKPINTNPQTKMSGEMVNDFVRVKVIQLMNQWGIKKVQLGEVLSKKEKVEPPQQKYLRAQRFLRGESEVSLWILIKIAHFFNKPLSYFLPDGSLDAVSDDSSTQKQPRILKESLQKLGWSDDRIEKACEVDE